MQTTIPMADDKGYAIVAQPDERHVSGPYSEPLGPMNRIDDTDKSNGAWNDGYSIIVDSDKWIEQRTAGKAEEMEEIWDRFKDSITDEIDMYADETSMLRAFLKTLELDPDNGDEVLSVFTPNHENNLDEDLSIYVFGHDGYEYAAIAEVTNHSSGAYTIYTDSTTERSYWYEYDYYELGCPKNYEHSLTVQGSELVTYGGSFATFKELFPNGVIQDCHDEDDADEEHLTCGAYSVCGSHHVFCPECGTVMIPYIRSL
ncbi:hypothetical protein GCM10010331_44540 [Streptomyces xanthochromogenes]|uniref:hypothetical protein n=1 Tax=Streptomyces xanthochromogenes TaxID=67384 RepID=UPI001679B47A|nr:hypothetical protein [Streptomyces xanthochromogenes]GHB52070.1 hypothetical protein GCM10010331_44540 [Streptomyces xanthochromogenes]